MRLHLVLLHISAITDAVVNILHRKSILSQKVSGLYMFHITLYLSPRAC